MEAIIGEKDRPVGPAEETLLEMGNIGTGSSMASLAHIIGQKVRYAPPVMKKVDYNGLAEWIGLAEENVVAVLIPFTGDITGMLLQIYKEDMRNVILKRLLDTVSVPEEMDGRMLDLIRETANIMASSYLTSLSACVGLKITLSDSAVSMDMTGAIVTALIGTASATFPEGICIGNNFSTAAGTEESCLLMVLREDSVTRIMEAVEVNG